MKVVFYGGSKHDQEGDLPENERFHRRKLPVQEPLAYCREPLPLRWWESAMNWLLARFNKGPLLLKFPPENAPEKFKREEYRLQKWHMWGGRELNVMVVDGADMERVRRWLIERENPGLGLLDIVRGER